MIATEKIENCSLIAGPCSAESEAQVMECARSLARMGVKVFRAGVWKPRTRPGNFEGAGVPALEWLKEGKATTSPFAVQEVADALRGTDIPVLVKNPINAELELWIGAFERLSNAGIRRLAAIHRGFSSYYERIYRYSPEWQIPIELRRRIPGLQVICDPSHMAGRSDLIPHLAQMALDMKADGLFIEVHPNPCEALSDRNQQLTPAQFKSLTEGLVYHREAAPSDTANLEPYRSKVQDIDLKIIQDLAERFRITGGIGEYKNTHNLAILQPDRYNAISGILAEKGKELGLDENFIQLLFETIHAESIRCQINKKNNI